MTNYNRILRYPDADPFAGASGDVDTSMPKLAEKLYNMEITAAESKQTAKGGEMVKITLKTTKDELDTDGKPVNKGFPIFHNFNCSESGGLTNDMIKKSGATILQAADLKKSSVRDLITDPKILVGKIVCVKIGTRKEGGGFPATSEVRQWVPVK